MALRELCIGLLQNSQVLLITTTAGAGDSVVQAVERRRKRNGDKVKVQVYELEEEGVLPSMHCLR